MNDRFKFRVWSKLSNIMSYEVCFGNFFQHSKTEKKSFDWISVSYGDNFISYRGDALKELVFMQCTGLKDKNGKLIYEGDILKIKDVKIPVEVKYGAIGFYLYAEPSNTAGYHNDKYIPEDCELIGNKFENSELLKECE